MSFFKCSLRLHSQSAFPLSLIHPSFCVKSNFVLFLAQQMSVSINSIKEYSCHCSILALTGATGFIFIFYALKGRCEKRQFSVYQKGDLRLFKRGKVNGCGLGVAHRRAIYKAYQSSLQFHTVGSFIDLHQRQWSLLTVLHGH